MKHKIRHAIVAMVLATSFAMAQSPPSATSTITGGIFEEAQDVYLSPTKYSMIENMLLFLMFDMPASAGIEAFQIGAGMWFGEIYLGGLATLDQGTRVGAETIDSDTDVLVDGNGQIVGRIETRSVEQDIQFDADDSIEILIGLGRNLGIRGSVNFINSSLIGGYEPGYAFPAGPTWNTISLNTPSPSTSTIVTDTNGAITMKQSELYGEGFDNTSLISGDVGIGLNLPLGETNLSLDGRLGYIIRNLDEFGAYQTYTSVPGADNGTSYAPTIGEDGADPVAVEGVTDYFYESGNRSDSNLTLSPSLDLRFLFPYTETVQLEGGWMMNASFELQTGSYNDTTGMNTNAAGYTESYYNITIDRVADSNVTTIDTTETWFFEAQDEGYFLFSGSLPMAARVTPSERFRFGIEYLPTIWFDSRTSSYSGTAVQRSVFDDGQTGDTADDTVDIQTVTAAGFSETTRSFNQCEGFHGLARG